MDDERDADSGGGDPRDGATGDGDPATDREGGPGARDRAPSTAHGEGHRVSPGTGPTILGVDRERLAWWLATIGVGALLAVAFHAVLGTLVLALFFYYGMRPAFERVESRIGHRDLAATVTVVGVLVPVVALLAYTTLLAASELARLAESGVPAAQLLGTSLDLESLSGQGGAALTQLLENPGQLLGGGGGGQVTQALLTAARTLQTITTGVVHLFIALTLAYFGLRDGPRLTRWLRANVAPEGSIADVFVRGVDHDLEVVYVGNVLTVLLVTVLATATYHLFNAVAPGPLTIPFPTLLAVLTGLATFVPIVVGKLVYVPIGAYLAARAVGSDASLLYPAGFLVGALVLLDMLPQMAIRPYLSGQTLHVGLVLIAYVLGAVVFGWYGLFFGPFLLVIAVHLLRTVVPELLHGETLTADQVAGIGSNVE